MNNQKNINPQNTLILSQIEPKFSNESTEAILPPNETEALNLLNEGKAYYNQARYKEAGSLFLRAIEACGASCSISNGAPNKILMAKLSYNISFAYQKLGQHENANNSCENAILLNPNDVDACSMMHYNKGFALFFLKKYQQSAISFNEAIHLKSKDSKIQDKEFCAHAWQNLAVALNSLRDLDAAASACDKAIELKQSDKIFCANNYYNKGTILLRNKEYTSAIFAFDAALKRFPQVDIELRSHALNNKGVALFKLHNCEKAFKLFKESCTLNPKFLLASTNKDTIKEYLPENHNEIEQNATEHSENNRLETKPQIPIQQDSCRESRIIDSPDHMRFLIGDDLDFDGL
ncbi:MAG: tetratricopeptide repeat protein [Rickettsiaceae bacterium]|nr:tetratricopeptide repeat protein [Rickettsiaceae bacterium]